MNLSLSMIPILGLLTLAFMYVVWATLRSARLAKVSAEYQELTKSVLEQDAELQHAFVTALIDGRPFADCLDDFQSRRAALVPAVRLNDPAGWDADELKRYALQRFEENMAEVNRKLGAGLAIGAMTVVGVCLVSATVLYHFQAGSPAIAPPPPSPAFDPLAAPADLPPLPPVPTPSSDGGVTPSPDSGESAVEPETPESVDPKPDPADKST